MKDFITVVAVGTTITTGATSASSALPIASSGEVPRFVRISATAACHVKIGKSTVAATANDMLIQPGEAEVIHIPQGITHIAAIQDSAAGKCNVVPLEQC